MYKQILTGRMLVAYVFAAIILVLCCASPVSAQRADALTRFTVDGLNAIATTSDGSYIATAGSDSLIRIWDVTTGTQVQAFPRSDTVLTVAFLPGDTTLLSVGIKDSAFRVWDWRTGTLLRKERLWRPILWGAVTGDGTTLAIWVTYPEEQLEFWSIEQGTYLKVAYKGQRKSDLMWLDSSNTRMLEWDRNGFTYLTQFEPPSRRRLPAIGVVYPGGLSPDGQRIVSPREGLPPTVHDATTLDTLFSLDSAHTVDQVYQAIYHPDGESIITLGQSRKPEPHVVLQRWRAADGAYIDTVAVIDSIFMLIPWMFSSRDGSRLILYFSPNVGGVVATLKLRQSASDLPVVPDLAKAAINIAPNPGSRFLRIHTNVHEAGAILYTVYDYTGREVTSWSEDVLQPGVHSTGLNVVGLTSGLYFCRVQAGKRVISTSFVVQH